MPFIAYLSQTLNKNNKQQQHTSLRLPRLSALRRPRTHQHPSQRPRRLQGVCILIKQDARVHYPTINSNQHPKVTWPASPHNPIQRSYRAAFKRREHRDNHSNSVSTEPCDSSGPNSVSRPTDSKKLQVPRPCRSRNSTEKQPVTDQSFIDDSTSE